MLVTSIVIVVAAGVTIVSAIVSWTIGPRNLFDALAARKGSVAGTKRPQKVRHNLPQPEHSAFVGREDESRLIHRLLVEVTGGANAVIIDGPGGVGKTSLALHIALGCVPPTSINVRRFDAIVWLSAKVRELSGESVVAIRSAALTLDDIYLGIAAVLENGDIGRAPRVVRAARVTALLRRHATLIVLDNLESILDPTVVRILRELPEPTKVLVTSREAVDWGFRVHLSEMPTSQLELLMTSYAAARNISIDAHAISDLADACRGNPLAATWSVAVVGVGHSVADIVRKLRLCHAAVVGFCYSESLSAIRGMYDFDLLKALSLFPDGGATTAVAKVAGLDVEARSLDLEGAVAALVRLSLVSHADARLATHPLAAAMSFEELARDPLTRKTYERRYVEHFAWFVERCVGSGFWSSLDRTESYALLGAERGNIARAVSIARQHGMRHELLAMVTPLVHYLYYGGYYDERLRLCASGVDAAMESGDMESASLLLIGGMGWIHLQRGEYRTAQDVIVRGLRIARRHNYAGGLVLAYAHLARIGVLCGYPVKALALLARATAYEVPGVVRCRAEFVRGIAEWRMGNAGSAERWLEHARGELRRSTCTPWPALDIALGDVLTEANQLDRAETLFAETLRVATATGRETDTGGAWYGLARIECQRGNVDRARSLAEVGASSFRRYGTQEEVERVEAFVWSLEPGWKRAMRRLTGAMRRGIG